MKRTMILAALFSAVFSVAAQAATLTKTVEVFALENSTNLLNTSPAGFTAPQALATGVILNIGDSFTVTASGSWSLDANASTPPPAVATFYGPDGTNLYGSVLIGGNTINFGSLVGRIGGGAYFKVGSLFTGTAGASGELFLAALDNDFFNNGGSVTARVEYPGPNGHVPAVPLPAGGLLSLSALGLLLARRRKG